MLSSELQKDHPLLKLRGRRVKEYTLEVNAWTGRFVGQAEFVLYLQDAGGESSERPVVEGLYGRNRIPGSHGEVDRGILDLLLASHAEFGSSRLALHGSELEHGIVGTLCETIEDTWSAMVYIAYGWRTLKQIQQLRHPLLVTHEGYLLFTHGFRGGWKDYYYSEGWWEGPIKLKAERPPTGEYRVLWDAESARILLGFLEHPLTEGVIQFREEGSDAVVTIPSIAFERTARSRALLILERLSLVDPVVCDERDHILTIYPPPEALGELSPEELGGLAAEVRERRRI